MDVRIFDLPRETDDKAKIEKVYCDLAKRYRNGEELDEVEITWMDTANNWLMST